MVNAIKNISVEDNNEIVDTADFEMDLDIDNEFKGFGKDHLTLGAGEAGFSGGGTTSRAQ